MNMHDGVVEDGVLSTCGICGCQVYMLDPEEQDWICDPCSMDGWSGFKSAWKLNQGDVVILSGKRHLVIHTDDMGGVVAIQSVEVGSTEVELRYRRSTAKVYVHTDREPELALETLRRYAEGS